MATEITEGFLLDLITKRRAGKFTAEELKFAADHPGVIRWAQENLGIIEGLRNGTLSAVKRNPFPSEVLAAELIPEYEDGSGQKRKWEVLEDVQPIEFKVGDLEFPIFLKDGDPGYIVGEELRRRAVELRGNFGLVAAKYLLEHQDEIPTEMQKFYIVLPGTLLRDSDGGLRVACLGFGGGRWVLSFRWVGHFRGFGGGGFDGRGRLARCKSAAAPAAA